MTFNGTVQHALQLVLDLFRELDVGQRATAVAASRDGRPDSNVRCPTKPAADRGYRQYRHLRDHSLTNELVRHCTSVTSMRRACGGNKYEFAGAQRAEHVGRMRQQRANAAHQRAYRSSVGSADETHRATRRVGQRQRGVQHSEFGAGLAMTCSALCASIGSSTA